MWVDFHVRGQQGKDFFTGGSVIVDTYFDQKQQFKVENILIADSFLINMKLFASQYINWWTGVVWIIVMFLSAVWTLTAPIHCRGSTGEQML